MSESKSNWDMLKISEHFAYVANEAERYLSEVKRKVKSNFSYQHVFDEHLAKFYVYNYLHGRTFLETREMLAEELKRLLEMEFAPPSEAFDKNRFLQYRKMFLTSLLNSHSE